MNNVFEIASLENWAGREWLVVGKGPSFAAVAGRDSLSAPVLALNHAIVALPPVVGPPPRVVAHCVDREVLDDCGAEIAARADYLLMPRVPNQSFRRGRKSLAELCRGHALLRMLDAERRLLCYERSGQRTADDGHRRSGLAPAVAEFARIQPGSVENESELLRVQLRAELVPIRFFSAEGAFGVLARAGARRIVSAGIDGGRSYAPHFGRLRPLENGRDSFDDQFPVLDEIARRWQIDGRRLR